MLRTLSAAALASLLFTTVSRADVPCRAEGQAQKKLDIVRTAANIGSLSRVVQALAATGLDDALKGEGPFTVFAPSDAAFGKLPAGTLEGLLKEENQATLAAILKYHVVSGRKRAQDLTAGHLTTLSGASVSISHVGGSLRINKSSVVTADIVCRNGIIHVIDEVLMPPAKQVAARAQVSAARTALEKAGTFKTLLKALEVSGLDKAVLDGKDALTVFAPTDEAFAKLPDGTIEKLVRPANRAVLEGILKYHVVKGKVSARAAVTAGEARTLQGNRVTATINNEGQLRINRSRVVKPDLQAGVVTVHVIDTVLMPH